MPPSADASARALALPASGVTTNASIFAKPLVLAALVAVALAAFLAPGTQLADVVLRLRLPDNDDAMRLVEVRDLLAGQGLVRHHPAPLSAAARSLDALVALRRRADRASDLGPHADAGPSPRRGGRGGDMAAPSLSRLPRSRFHRRAPVLRLAC